MEQKADRGGVFVSKITVKAEELKGANLTLNEIIADLDNIHSRINHITWDLRDTWDGAACDEYISRLMKQNQDLKEVIKLLEEFSSYAIDSAKVFEVLDELFKKFPYLGGTNIK